MEDTILGVMLLSGAIAGIAGAGPVMADDWPQWMGPNRDAVWSEEGVEGGVAAAAVGGLHWVPALQSQAAAAQPPQQQLLWLQPQVLLPLQHLLLVVVLATLLRSPLAQLLPLEAQPEVQNPVGIEPGPDLQFLCQLLNAASPEGAAQVPRGSH